MYLQLIFVFLAVHPKTCMPLKALSTGISECTALEHYAADFWRADLNKFPMRQSSSTWIEHECSHCCRPVGWFERPANGL